MPKIYFGAYRRYEMTEEDFIQLSELSLPDKVPDMDDWRKKLDTFWRQLGKRLRFHWRTARIQKVGYQGRSNHRVFYAKALGRNRAR